MIDRKPVSQICVRFTPPDLAFIRQACACTSLPFTAWARELLNQAQHCGFNHSAFQDPNSGRDRSELSAEITLAMPAGFADRIRSKMVAAGVAEEIATASSWIRAVLWRAYLRKRMTGHLDSPFTYQLNGIREDAIEAVEKGWPPLLPCNFFWEFDDSGNYRWPAPELVEKYLDCQMVPLGEIKRWPQEQRVAEFGDAPPS